MQRHTLCSVNQRVLFLKDSNLLSAEPKDVSYAISLNTQQPEKGRIEAFSDSIIAMIKGGIQRSVSM